jgi:hypothetical protein
MLPPAKNKQGLPSKNALHDANESQDTQTQAHARPGQAAPLVQVPCFVAQKAAQANDTDEVADDDCGAGIVAKATKESGQGGVGLARLGPGLLLGEIGLCACSFGLALQPSGLRLGLNILLGKVRGDGADGGCVDVDQRGSAGGLRGLDLGDGRSCGL